MLSVNEGQHEFCNLANILSFVILFLFNLINYIYTSSVFTVEIVSCWAWLMKDLSVSCIFQFPAFVFVVQVTFIIFVYKYINSYNYLNTRLKVIEYTNNII